ncbi:hypothetical protein L1987_61240 [Smallanthus sonchifolius]|uniref:Uncharacterized protein n=1 Tax=Smallanthus sonchifolius TaxID=185202 RepID=A0ACB9DAN1_9ASTR|nr:hypothetical protein L1987_61240 [Smallanthus sonchifolius]
MSVFVNMSIRVGFKGRIGILAWEVQTLILLILITVKVGVFAKNWCIFFFTGNTTVSRKWELNEDVNGAVEGRDSQRDQKEH